MSIINKIKTTITQEISQLIRYRTELVIIDESELSELQDQAALWNRGHNLDKLEISKLRQQVAELESDIESITNDATEADGEIRDLKEQLESWHYILESHGDGGCIDEQLLEVRHLKQTIQELEDRAQELQGELDRWHSLGSDYGINYDVSDVERKLELLNERTEQLNEWETLGSGYGVTLDFSDVEEKLDILAEWEDLIGQGLSPSEIQEQLDAAYDWVELGDDTGMMPCEIQQELDRLEEVDAALEEAKNQLGSAQSKAIEIGLIWRSLEIALDC